MYVLPPNDKEKSMDAGTSAYVVDISETANYPLAIAMVEGCDKVFYSGEVKPLPEQRNNNHTTKPTHY
jgi:hypothetical protein